jgi:hypothetical protein
MCNVAFQRHEATRQSRDLPACLFQVLEHELDERCC